MYWNKSSSEKWVFVKFVVQRLLKDVRDVSRLIFVQKNIKDQAGNHTERHVVVYWPKQRILWIPVHIKFIQNKRSHNIVPGYSVFICDPFHSWFIVLLVQLLGWLLGNRQSRRLRCYLISSKTSWRRKNNHKKCGHGVISINSQ